MTDDKVGRPARSSEVLAKDFERLLAELKRCPEGARRRITLRKFRQLLDAVDQILLNDPPG